MKTIKSVSTMFLTFVFCVVAFSTNALAHTANIVPISGENSDAEYTAVPVSPQMYQYCNSDFGDIRIYDKDGKETPYFIEKPIKTYTQKEEKRYVLKQLDRFVKDGYLYLDYTLAENYSTDIMATSIELEAVAKNFAKSVQLSGSYDGMEWTHIANDNIYSVENAKKLNIEFSAPQKYTHYRIRLSESSHNPDIIGASLKFASEVSESLRYTSTINAEYTVEQNEKNTIISLPSIKNMEIESVEIVADGMFKRDAMFLGKSANISRLTFDGETVSDTVIDANGVKAPENCRIVINNGDDAPLDIKGIKVTYYENYIVFKQQNMMYRAEFGDDTRTKPLYDIEKYKDEVLKRDMSRSEFSDIQIIKADSKKIDIDTRLIFNIAVSAVAVILIVLLAVSLKKNKSA